MEAKKKSAPIVRLNSYESMLVGAIGGTIETTLQMPLITWKICVQEGRAFPKRIPEWYRGVFVNGFSVSPITAVQCYADSLFGSLLSLNDSRKLTAIERLGCSAAAGCVSGLIYGPVDLMVIQQQKFVASLPQTFSIIKEQYGAMRIYRGLASTMVRESIYTMGYLGIAPIVNGRLENMKSIPWFEEHRVATSVLSAMIGGTFAALLTHPVDTAKTCVQSDLKGDTFPNAIWTGRHLFNTGGISVLFKGVVPRTLRLCGACFVISQVRENFIKLKTNNLAKQD